jgi:Domain of unknown function (DUF6371)
MSNYRFFLEPYKGSHTRFTCPACGSKKTFTRYIDSRTGDRLPELYGICDRSDKCGYILNPYKDGYSQRAWEESKTAWRRPVVQAKPEPSFIEYGVFAQSIQAHDSNNFCKFLKRLFGANTMMEVVNRYQIGTANKWTGSTVFWQIDQRHRVHAGKIMLYDEKTGHRVKDHTTWAHSAMRLQDFTLNQCFFGEHLLEGNNKQVGIVESEKTACIASIKYPTMVWLAAGGKQGLGGEKCKVLAGRNVMLFPDAGAEAEWSDKGYNVNTLIQSIAAEPGYDLADYIIDEFMCSYSKTGLPF